MVHKLATATVIDALLNPDDEVAGILDAERNLILVHGFMPPSEAVQDFFDERSMQNVLVRFPETPCPACGGQRPTPVQQPSLSGQITEETAHALATSVDALTDRLGEVVELLGEDRSMSPELVRIAASLDQVTPRLPALEGVDTGIARLVELAERLAAIVPLLERVERVKETLLWVEQRSNELREMYNNVARDLIARGERANYEVAALTNQLQEYRSAISKQADVLDGAVRVILDKAEQIKQYVGDVRWERIEARHEADNRRRR